MDRNQIILKRHSERNQESSIVRYKTKDEIDGISQLIFKDVRNFVGSWGTVNCHCGVRTGLVEYEGKYYALCSRCDDLIIGGDDRELVILEWEKEMRNP